MAIQKGIIGKVTVKSDHEVEWTIDKFFSYYTAANERYHSPRFTIWGSEWDIRVYPNGQKTELNHCVGWISLYLGKLGDHEAPPVGASYTMGVKKVDGTVEQLRSEASWVFRNGTSDGYSRVVFWLALLQRKSELAPLGSLTFTCTLRTEEFFESPGNLDLLSRNLTDLFISKKSSDVTLVVKGKEFSVHKSILSARSPVLAAMLEVDLKEKRTGIVQIEDCDPEVFNEFLTYLYSGKVQKGSTDALELYRIADKYKVRDLISYCCISVMTSLSVDNVLDAVMLGYQFNQNDVINYSQDFFNQNFEKITAGGKWDKFLSENTTLANELLESMKKLKEAGL